MLPVSQQGLKVLGIPIGYEAFVQRFLDNKSTEQQVLFPRIPWVNDPQSVGFHVRFHQGQCLVKKTPGATMRTFGHAFVRFLAHQMPQLVRTRWRPFQSQQVGLDWESLQRVRHAAHWASWADSLRMVRARHPAVAERMIDGLQANAPVRFQSVKQCNQSVLDAGLEMPPWQELPDSPSPR